MSFFARLFKKSEEPKPLEQFPVALWKRGSNGPIAEANDSYRKLIDAAEDGALKELTPTLYKGVANRERLHVVVDGQRRLFDCVDTGKSGYAVDITELEELEDQRDDLKHALRQVMEHASSAMAFFDGSRRLLRYNQAYAHLWGFDSKELDKRPAYEELLEQLREQRKLPEQVDFAEFRRQQIAYFTDLREPHQEFLYLPDGTSLRVVMIPYSTRGLVILYDNITDRLALEQSFNQTIAVNKAAFDHLYEGIAVFSENGKLKLSNPRYAEIWQIDWEFLDQHPRFEELLEANEYLYDSELPWQERRKAMLGIFHTRKRETQTLELIDGRVIQWAVIPLPDGATLMTYLDISDSVRIEQNLRERNQALEEAGSIKTKFLANVSYNLRSPLTSIKGFAEFLIEGGVGPLNDKQKEYLNDMHSAALDLSAMIDDVLDMASLEAGYTTLDAAEFDMYRMLSSLFPFVQERLQREEIELDFQCSPAIGQMVGDERRLRHAIVKALDQCIALTKKGGSIQFHVVAKEERISITIQDHSGQEDAFIENAAADTESMVATDTLDAIGSPAMISLFAMHGGTIDAHYLDDQHYRVAMKFARHYSGFNDVQISNPL